MLGVKAITIYAKYDLSPTTVYLMCFGLLMLLCGIFSASNAIHVCIQLPTSHIALKIQKYGQLIVLILLLLLQLYGWVNMQFLSQDNSSLTEELKDDLYIELKDLLLLELVFFLLFAVTTLSCMMV
jgi:hypothetical protein